MDLSHKDKKYFINGSTYNCPFCNRNNLRYKIIKSDYFDESDNKKVYFYIVECLDSECRKRSLHLSQYDLCRSVGFMSPPSENVDNPSFAGSTRVESGYPFSSPIPDSGRSKTPQSIKNKEGDEIELDDAFFYHNPTSFFTLDDRIPQEIREALNQAENCLKSNYLTGSSACLRKAIYKLLKKNDVPEKDEKNDFIKYETRIDLFADKVKVPKEDLDDLKTIHGISSQELHENDWEDLKANHIKFLIALLKDILNTIYAEPDERTKKRTELKALKKAASKKNK